ncbi:MAG: S-layer homology domain-containing protein [Clostridia bacterium]|nr:S-layer homology domain-containing protein [Clostridia bacterium]
MKRILSITAILIALVTILSFSVNAAHPFTDVRDNHWYKEAVEYCYTNEFVKGMTETEFGPTTTVNRAMVVTILANMAEYYENAYNGEVSFPDVKTNHWFAKTVHWAYQNGVANGKGEKFEPLTAVTRQELAMFLANYAAFTGSDVTPTDNSAINIFSDSTKVASWAKASMNWAVENGIMSGNKNGTLNPRGTATRAELAVMIMNFDKQFNRFAEDITVSAAFTDDMLLQRDEKCSVWGFADNSQNGRIVRCEIDGHIAIARVNNGKWNAVFSETFPANGEGTTLTVTDGIEDREYKNILFGDMYYIFGQSNAYYSLAELIIDLNYKNLRNTLEVDYDDNRDLRFFRVSNTDYNFTGEDARGTDKLFEDVYHNEGWQTPSDIGKKVMPFDKVKPSTQNGFDRNGVSAEVFSALGYLFAYNMSNETDVPIGVIEIDASGHPLISFAPNELAEKWGHEAYDPNTGTYYYNCNGLVADYLKTRFAYNQQLYPLINFSTAGILWYQGESDWINCREIMGADYKNTFTNQFTELMTYFRQHMGNDDFPVYIMEFPSCFEGKYNGETLSYFDFGSVRAELGTIPQVLDNSYIVSSSDYFNDNTWINNIHPYIKHWQAERLANIMLSTGNYDVEDYDINYTSGPVLKSSKYVNDNTVELNFNYVGDGLKVFDETGEDVLLGFEILVNGAWINCENAVITDKDTVTITYDGGKIDAVRYNRIPWAIFRVSLTLGNSEGIPAVAFIDFWHENTEPDEPDDPIGPIDPNTNLTTDYTVSSAFTDNMILQKDESCSVWGWAPETEDGKYVKVTINGKTAYAEIKNGEWKATFSETFPVNKEGTSIYINDTEMFKDVLFGDVYYVIGQSNVHYSLLEMRIDSITKRFEDDVVFDFDDARDIRFFRNSNTYHMTNTGDRAQGTATLYKDAEVPKGWQKPSDVKIDYDSNYPADINNFPRAVASSEVFSALGYLFAYNMSEVTDTPIGVIEIDASGFPLIAFAPNELAEKWGTEAYNEATGQYFYYLKGVNMEGYATGDLANPTMYTRFAYNQQIYPLINFSTAGILWYQGESDWASTRETLLDSSKGTFQTQFAELMTYYREHMGNNDFPVYVMEFPSCFPSYNPNKIQHYIPTGAVRTEVGIIPQILDNSYVVACSDFFYDVNWENNIHPYIKHLQAARLANMALSVGYDIEGYDINYTSGPVLKDVNYVSDNKVEINFNYVADGLRSFDESGDEIIFGLDILVDGQWVEYLDAVITDEDTVTVEYDGGTIEGVRYNRNTEAMFYAQVTLGSYNEELSRAIPAVAFVNYKN